MDSLIQRDHHRIPKFTPVGPLHHPTNLISSSVGTEGGLVETNKRGKI